jgi:iron complex outermembrane receptor protein
MQHKIILLVSLSLMSHYSFADHNPTISLDEIEVRAPLIDSRILKHPATVETYDRKQIEDSINAATPAQTLKYLPSIQVRERYIGDRNGIIATRTIGTLSSAQSMLYADGVLLSNLLGNSFAFPPRWGMVSPEEIESISMMYGPFSALYAGNSFGGVMSIATRMPEKFETHASAQVFSQNFKLYGTDETYTGNHQTASVGNKVDNLSFWLGVDRLENQGQPMSFSTATSICTSACGNAVEVSGEHADKSETNARRLIFGANSIDYTEQMNAKLKLVYDISPTIKASYSLGVWDLNGRTDVESYIKDASGNAVFNHNVTIGGKTYKVTGLSPGESESLHVMHTLDLKSNTKGFFDWQLTFSDYEYQKDKNSSSNLGTSTAADTNLSNPYITRTGRVTDLSGTGWTVFDARTTFRPDSHMLDIGYHVDQYQLKSDTNNTADWQTGNKGQLASSARGETQTHALYLQDKWQLSPQWALTLGGRAEYWKASNGENTTSTASARYQEVTDTKFSPKVSLSFEPVPVWGFRAAFGQAFRFPTVSELFQPLQNGANFVASNPNLKPEEVIAAELTAERRFENGLFRASFFSENKYDALISQTLTPGSAIPYDTGVCVAPPRATGCSFVQNIDHIRTRGLELATQWQDVVVHGLDLQGSATFTEAEVLSNSAAPNMVGNKPPRIPRNMFKAVATYHQGSNLTYSLAARYSGRQYNALDNSDVNPDTFGGASKFFIMDVKANYKFADRFSASLGIDNLNNYKSYVFHPYPQRTAYVQLKFDY